MKQGVKKHAMLGELLRYFGFPLIAVAVVAVAFIITSIQTSAEIQKGIYQILHDATMQQDIAIRQYMNLLTKRIELIGNNYGSEEPERLIETLKAELTDENDIIIVGYANQNGELISAGSNAKNVAAEAWFQKGIAGKTAVAIQNQNGRDELQKVVVSAPARTENGISGVLFAILNGERINHLFQTLAYDGDAFSIISDTYGRVLFVESGKGFSYVHKSIFDLINDHSLTGGQTVEKLKDQLRNGNSIQYVFEYDGKTFYAVTKETKLSNWYITSVINTDKADYIQQRVGLYHLGMLFIMLLMGIAMTVQAYLHERATVRKLEQDRDLLKQSAQRYQLITQLSKEVFFEIDLNTREISFNDSFESMFGIPAPSCSIDHLEQCENLFYDSDRKLFQSLINRLRAGDAKAREEIRMVNARGAVRWKLVEIFTIFDQDGNASQLVGKIADIDRQKQSMQRLIRRADSDPLTGLLNRGAMERSVNTFLASDGKGKSHALLILDFDNFKTVNDTLGHAAGDHLLVSFAAGMQRLFRAGDVLSRIGGDEYMALLKDVQDDAAALDKAEALRAEMADLSRKIGVPVSISVGIAVYPRDGIAFDSLYQLADIALYAVKNHGKNNVALYSGDMAAKMKSKPEAVKERTEDSGKTK